MSLSRILVIDDQYANEADLRADFCDDCKLIGIDVGVSDAELDRLASSRPEAAAAAVFCSGQEGDGAVVRNQMEAVERAVAAGWPSPAGWRWALVLVDVRFDSKPTSDGDGSFGFVILEHLAKRYPDQALAPGNCEIPVVMLSSLSWVEKNKPAGQAGARAYVEKKDLTAAELSSLLAEHGLLEDTQSMGRPFEKLLMGRSLSLLRVLRDARQIARRRYGNALILGPQGSGKSTLAWYIHVNSRGSGSSFIQYYVAPTTSELQYAELFGYWTGAYSDARESRAGRAEEAHEGTLLIDEIHGLQTKSQQELLQFGRLTDESHNRRTLRRLGSFPTSPPPAVQQARQSVRGRLLSPETSEIEVDVLLLAATNEPLDSEEWRVRYGFAEPLYTRLGIGYGNPLLRFPPLSERRGDIHAMFCAFLQTETQAINGVWPKFVDQEVVQRLEAYGWAGNVAELQGVARSAANAARTFEEVLPRHLPPTLFLKPTQPPAPDQMALERRIAELEVKLERTRAELERERREKTALTLANLPEQLASLPVDPNDPALSGVKGRLDNAFQRLMQRLAGAVLERWKNPVNREINRTQAMQYFTGEQIEKSKVPRLLKEILGEAQTNKISNEEVERLLDAWRTGPPNIPKADTE